MKNKNTNKTRLLNEAHEIATGLHEVGLLDFTTMKEFDALCIPQPKKLSASKIKKIRNAAGVSQAVLAKFINVSVAAIKQWERGERKPSGPALKLLNLIDNKGIQAII